MSKQYKNNSEMLAAVHETARGLRDAGVMDEATMKTFDEMCLTPKKETRTEFSAYIDKLKQILKEGSKYRLVWAVPAMAMILAIVMGPEIVDQFFKEHKPVLAESIPAESPASEELKPVLAESIPAESPASEELKPTPVESILAGSPASEELKPMLAELMLAGLPASEELKPMQ